MRMSLPRSESNSRRYRRWASAFARTSSRNLSHVSQQSGLLLAVEVFADQIHLVGAVLHHAFAPWSGRADRHQRDRRVGGAHGVGELIVLLYVIFQRHVAELPAAVHFVADAPVLDRVRFGMAVVRAPFPHRTCGRSVRIFDLLNGSFHAAQSTVDGDVRFRFQQPAEHHELVQAKVIVFDARPGRVLARRPAIARSDAVLPVVATDEIPAGPAVDG